MSRTLAGTCGNCQADLYLNETHACPESGIKITPSLGEIGEVRWLDAPALFVKVTDVLGRFETGDPECIRPENEADHSIGVYMANLLPREAIANTGDQPLGRYKITVEFTPAGPEAGK